MTANNWANQPWIHQAEVHQFGTDQSGAGQAGASPLLWFGKVWDNFWDNRSGAEQPGVAYWRQSLAQSIGRVKRGLVIGLAMLFWVMVFTGNAIAGNAIAVSAPAGQASTPIAPCPPQTICVSTTNTDPQQAIAPMVYRGDRDTVRAALLQILSVVPSVEVVAQDDDTIQFVAGGRLPGWQDAGEFYLPANTGKIYMKAGVERGAFDLGINRRRLEQIRFALIDLGF